MTDAMISFEVLSWAREKNEFSVDYLAQNLGISSEKITSWETGKSFPTFRQAIDLAKELRIPFGYLFLKKPPIDELLISDFRTIKDRRINIVSPELLDVIYELLRKQLWYREYLINEGTKPNEYINKYTINTDITEISQFIRNTFNINIKVHTNASSWDEYYRILINNLEERGVLVLRSGIVGSNTRRKLSLDEFRGFSLFDDFAPIIFINSLDFKASQIFTLLHELVHLLLGQSGISNPAIENIFNRDESAIEKYCNKVASEVLVPHELFTRYWQNDVEIIENIHNLSRWFRVSSYVILIKAFKNKLLDNEEYNKLRRMLLQELSITSEVTNKGDSGNFYNSLKARNSDILINAIIGSTLEGKVLYREASHLLGIRVNTIESIAVRMGNR